MRALLAEDLTGLLDRLDAKRRARLRSALVPMRDRLEQLCREMGGVPEPPGGE